MSALSNEGRQALDMTASLPEAEQKQVVAEMVTANPGLLPSGDKYKTQLWLMLLGVLFLLALVAIVGAVVLATNNKGTTALISLASAVVAGTIGLFANPPTGR